MNWILRFLNFVYWRTRKPPTAASAAPSATSWPWLSSTGSLRTPIQKPRSSRTGGSDAMSLVTTTTTPDTTAGTPISSLSISRIRTCALGNNISRSARGTSWNSLMIVDPGGERQALDVLALRREVLRVLELHVDEDLRVVRELDGPPPQAEQVRHLLLAGAHAAAVEHDLLEVVEVGLQPDLHQRLLDERAAEVVGADALEVRVLRQGGELVDEVLLRRLPLGRAQFDDRARLGVGVERVVGVLQRLEPGAELLVHEAGQQLGEGQERLPVLGRHLVRAHRDDAGPAERDESLTGHCEPLPGAVAVPEQQVFGAYGTGPLPRPDGTWQPRWCAATGCRWGGLDAAALSGSVEDPVDESEGGRMGRDPASAA